MSANSPWNYSSYWLLQADKSHQKKDLKVDWEQLQKPGFSADFIQHYSRMDLDITYPQSDWLPTAAKALMRNNMPLLAYIAGKPSAFTSKDHNFLPDENFSKQLIIINNSREEISCECDWKLNLPEEIIGNKMITLTTGNQERITLDFDLPASLKPGNYLLKAKVKFSNGEIQNDEFEINILSNTKPVKQLDSIALFDPNGETKKLLEKLNIRFQLVNSDSDFNEFDILIIGKKALTVDGDSLNLENVRNGLKVIQFEQTTEVLEKRFGFRVHEYGLRQVFKRVANHPVLNELENENLHDWAGEATILPERLDYTMDENVFNGAPTVKWCDIPVTRIWRCGNRGNVASVLIEKPVCGNFMPIVDGGFSLQYSPLMEYREGKGIVLFCQIDVNGRTEEEPAALKLVQNMINYVSTWKPKPKHEAVYVGNSDGLNHLKNAGISVLSFENTKPKNDEILVAGPGFEKLNASETKAIQKWVSSGGRLLAIGLNQQELNMIVPFNIKVNNEEHISTWFEPFELDSPFAGIAPADAHNRAPKEFPLAKEGAEIIGNGVLASAKNDSVILCALKPWENDYSKEKHNVKQTFRRSSFLLNRLLGNMDIESKTPLLARFNVPLDSTKDEKRWQQGFYLDEPEEWDDPYRFFRW